jgi:GntR family transcriptional repressor for pyruvate dehydrogenase complex
LKQEDQALNTARLFTFSPSNQETPGFVSGNLASRVAEQLLDKMRGDSLVPGSRLPSEIAMAKHFGVSRTVMREAIARLKADGLLETRRGSGAFVLATDRQQTLVDGDRMTEESVGALLNLIEVRRGVESEVAALAAVRRTPGQLAEIEHALRRIDEAVAAGSDGVEEDTRLHQCIAAVTGNPYWVRIIEMFAQHVRSAVRVTRANEARREDFSRQVRAEHEQIVSAIAARDPDLARAAATQHMEGAAQRVRAADRDFWRGEGGELARQLSPAASDAEESPAG